MKKDLFKKPLMISLALCLATSVNVFGSSSGVTSINGKSSLIPETINVVIPTAFAIAIDPLEKKEPGQQIYSPQLPIINKSDIPIEVSVNTLLDSTAISLPALDVLPREKVNQEDVNVDAPQAYVGLIPAATLNVTVDNTTNAMTVANPTDSKTVEVAVSDDDVGGDRANLTFALDKAIYETVSGSTSTFKSLAANNKGVCSFRFVGKVNPHAAWADNKLKPKVKYSIKSINDTVMNTYKFMPEANALVKASNAHDVNEVSRPSITYNTDANIYKLNAKADVVYTLNFGEGASAGDTISEVRLNTLVINTPVGYKYDASAKALTLPKDAPYFSGAISTPGKYNVVVTFANGKKAVSTLEVKTA